MSDAHLPPPGFWCEICYSGMLSAMGSACIPDEYEMIVSA